MAARYTKVVIPGKDIAIYAGQKKIGAGFEELLKLDLYSGAKVADLIETAYRQGQKDGAANVIKQFEKVARRIPHNNPGRPRKPRK